MCGFSIECPHAFVEKGWQQRLPASLQRLPSTALRQASDAVQNLGLIHRREACRSRSQAICPGQGHPQPQATLPPLAAPG